MFKNWRYVRICIAIHLKVKKLKATQQICKKREKLTIYDTGNVTKNVMKQICKRFNNLYFT